MKRNVYDQVRLFYEEEISWESVIKREWVEGFFRFKAWQGADDETLKDLWNNIYMFEIYLSYFDNELLDDISIQEYSLVVEWLAENVDGYTRSVKFVRHFFDVLIEFYKYLENKKIIMSTEEIEQAAQVIAGGNKVCKITQDIESLLDTEQSIGKLDVQLHNLADANDIMQDLMDKITTFYNSYDYVYDIHRAMVLYSGDRELDGTDEDKAEFWIGFWDFFMFDYHLMRNDKNPLRHFLQVSKELSDDEKRLLNTILDTKFVTFYIIGIFEQGWVECKDLFTNETFYLPRPDGDYRILKKLLFTGHIMYGDITMVNNLSSVEMSVILRRRIREEVERQKQIFEAKVPKATWQDFFDRHAVNVKHTIDLLTTYAKLNVTPHQQVGRTYPNSEKGIVPNKEVTALLAVTMREFNFSQYDTTLVTKMWNDFNQLYAVIVRKPITWVLSLMYLFSTINRVQGLSAKALAEQFEVSANTIYKQRSIIANTLQIENFDPRYIDEEGFMYALFLS